MVLMQRGSCEERKQPRRKCEISAETRLRRDGCEQGRLEVSQQMLFLNITLHPVGQLAGSTNLEAETVPFNTWLQPNQNIISISLGKIVHMCVWKIAFFHLCSRCKMCDLMPISCNISLTGYSARVLKNEHTLQEIK